MNQERGQTLVRLGVGGYWLFFASQKWGGVAWMKPLMDEAAKTNPVPVLHQILNVLVIPNWQLFAIAQGTIETIIGALIIVGLAVRPAALIAVLLAIELSLTMGPLSADLGGGWLYYLAIPASLAVLVHGSGALALGRRKTAIV
jgi:uncharacterized membrane protein YphA (DoxX/SURF4 family)